VIILLDQLTKYLAVYFLVLHEPKPILPFFNLTLAYNTGAAFSFLNQASGWQAWLFSGIAIIISLIIIVWLYRLPSDKPWLSCALALILGGALGNLIDRIVHGYVVDFVDLYIGQWHFAFFNVADAAVCIGALMLALDLFRHPKDFG
jgi:signal peptidase II